MSARKIRTTSVGLVAMPADRDESTVTADNVGRDRALFTAFGELLPMFEVATSDAWEAADRCGSYEEKRAGDAVAEAIQKAWDEALDAAGENDLKKLRAALQRAHDAASAAGYSTEHEDAALAMLPPVAGRRAA